MEQSKAKTADTPICKCGVRTALVSGHWYYRPDREPYLNGVEEESKIADGEEWISGHICDNCASITGLFSDNDEYQSHISNLEAQNKELREALRLVKLVYLDEKEKHGYLDFMNVRDKVEQALKEDNKDG